MNASPPADSSFTSRCSAWRRLKDACVTMALWGYFTIGFVVLFSPFYLLAFFFARERATAFQRLNSRFYGGFFRLCRILTPRTRWEIDPRVRKIRSAIVVCNHISYLDAILLVSLFRRHTTIAKDRLFRIPLFGRLLAWSGYIPSSGGGRFADLLMDSLDTIAANLEAGGNIIVFPEGTRSRDGQVGALQKGAFKIARFCRAPIKVLRIQNTNQLFTPGKFLFNTSAPTTVRLTLVAEITPDYENSDFSIAQLMINVQDALRHHGPNLCPPPSP